MHAFRNGKKPETNTSLINYTSTFICAPFSEKWRRKIYTDMRAVYGMTMPSLALWDMSHSAEMDGRLTNDNLINFYDISGAFNIDSTEAPLTFTVLMTLPKRVYRGL